MCTAYLPYFSERTPQASARQELAKARWAYISTLEIAVKAGIATSAC